MAFFALLIFMGALFFTYVKWDEAYKAMLAGGKVLPVAGWMASTIAVWVIGIATISALI